MSPIKVDRCVCEGKTFKEIKSIAKENGFTEVEQLSEAGICCCKCRMCEPYVRSMFENGETEFELGSYVGNRTA